MEYTHSRQQLREVYNKFAQYHDSERELFDNHDQLHMLAKLIKKGSTVLDAGCGTGYPVVKFFHDQDHHVIGSDIAEEALKYVKLHAPAVETVHCDTSELNFSENSFDLITSFYSIMHLPIEKQIQSFKNFYKMLKPNGITYVTLACREYTGKSEFSGLHAYLGWPLPIHHVSEEEYQKHFETIGFKNINFEKKDTGNNITLLWFYGEK